MILKHWDVSSKTTCPYTGRDAKPTPVTQKAG